MFESGMVVYGATITISNLKILTFTHTPYTIGILIIFAEIALYSLGILFLNF